MKHLVSVTATPTSVTGRQLQYLSEGKEYVVSLFLNCNNRRLHWPCEWGWLLRQRSVR